MHYEDSLEEAAGWAFLQEGAIEGHTACIVAGRLKINFKRKYPENRPFPVDELWIPRDDIDVPEYDVFPIFERKRPAMDFFMKVNPIDQLTKK